MRICQSKGLIDDGNEVDTTAACFAGRVIFNPGWHWFYLNHFMIGPETRATLSTNQMQN